MVNELENVLKTSRGIKLSTNQAKMVWQGNKTLILSSKGYSNIENNLFYVIGGNEAFCIIKIKNKSLIDSKEFIKRRDGHRISDEEKYLWWPDKKKLFAYEFDIVKKFEFPEVVSYSEDDFIINDLSFVSDLVKREKELVELVDVYDATKFDVEQLKNDFKIMLAINNSLVEGKKTSIDEKKILSLTSKIMGELESKYKIVFHEEHMSKNAKELIFKIKNNTKNLADEKYSFVSDVLVMKNTVLFSNNDIIVNIDSPSKNLKKLVESKIFKILPENLMDETNIVWSESKESLGEVVPIYDLVLVKKSSFDKVDFSSGKIHLFESFNPMISGKKFDDVKELSDFLYGV
ncbi:MAG TPA: hypothetical protein VMX55_02315 [candidate division Zixibacteria bacterium]|nr:hypothetical protein [candidate division Zixibacteria bacterium]